MFRVLPDPSALPKTRMSVDPEDLQRSVLAALSAVGPEGSDVVRTGQVHDLAVEPSGDVRFAVQLRSGDPSTLVRDLRAAVESIEGVGTVKVNVQLPQSPAGGGPGGAPAGGGGLQPGSVPAPTPRPGILADTRHVIAVSSGKGGVGKSMVSTNLAVALAQRGLAVGLLDADIYGPNIPLMFGESRKPEVVGEKGAERIRPLEAHGVKLMSLGFLLEKEQPAIMRGPLIAGILKQFLEQVAWGSLDVMVVDMPPGTGDAQLSLVQTIDLDGAVMVTTPQEVATGDVRRGVKMFERVNTRVLGIVENMAGFTCPSCGETHDLFGRGGGERLAGELGLDFLGRVPIDSSVRAAGDEGRPTVASAPESAAAQALNAVADRVLASVRGEVPA